LTAPAAPALCNTRSTDLIGIGEVAALVDGKRISAISERRQLIGLTAFCSFVCIADVRTGHFLISVIVLLVLPAPVLHIIWFGLIFRSAERFLYAAKFAVVLIFTLMLTYGCLLARHLLTERSALKIVDCVEEYKYEHCVFPDTLAEIVPTCLDVVPNPVFGYGPYEYRNGSLQYHTSVFCSFDYNFSDRSWRQRCL
jgi:hypothetical protein